MKKILVLLMLLITTSIYCVDPGEVYMEPKLGFGINFGVESNDSNAEFEVEGITFYGLEGYYKLSDRIDIGWGLLYMESTTTKKNPDNSQIEESTKKTPIYLSVKAHLFPNWALNPYIKFMYGYQFVDSGSIDDMGDGRYMGGAVGLDLMNLTIESYVTVEEIYEGEDYDAAIGFGLAFGYKI